MSGPIGDRDGGGEHLADRSPNLAIVVVNFGSHLLLSENLASIDLAGLDAGAIVVDSFSSEEERLAIGDLCASQGWELLTQSTNVGFGIGMNLGVAHAIERGCSTVLLLNPDVSIETGAVAELVERNRDRSQSLVSPRLDRPDGTVWFAGGQLDRRTGRTRSRPDKDQTGRDRWLTGACILVDTSTWSELGGFDDRFFLYWEDVDLSQRLLDSGGDVHVDHGVVAVHDVGATQQTEGKSPVYARYMCRNRLLFASLRLSRGERWRWIATAPSYAVKMGCPNGRKAALRDPSLIGPALRGTGAGLAIALRSLMPGR